MKKILIIEDDRILLETASDFLREEGFEVLQALDGQAGIELAQSDQPDLILCDIFMPRFDGYQVHARLQSQISTAMIPFIFMTAKAGKEDIRFGMELGADDYITKPIHFKELLNSIKARLDKFDKTVRASEARYHSLFELAKDAILILNHPGGEIRDANRACTNLLGYSRKELAGMNLADIHLPGQADLDLIHEKTGNYPDDSRYAECFWKHKKGHEIPVQISGSRIDFFNETVFILSARDISELKAKEKALRESEERYRDLVENTGEGLGVVDPEEHFRYANPAACEIFGLPSEQLLGRSIVEFLDAETIEVIKQQTLMRQQGEKSFYEMSVNRPDGTRRWIIVTATPQFDTHGTFTGTFGIFRDITESRQAQELLKESEKRYREISDLTNDWIWEINPEWKYINVSPKIFNILGYTPEEMIGKTPFDFLIPEDVSVIKESLREYVHRFAPFNGFVTRATHKNGQVVYLESSGVAILDANGRYMGYRGADRDITLRKLYEKELIVSKEKAEESDRLKSSILANMSHELRTPLNGILGFAEILREELRDTDYELMAENIHSSGRRLMSTLNSIITLSQLEAGKVSLSLKKVDIRESILAVSRNLDPLAKEKKINIQHSDVRAVSILTDEHLFRQLFRQILDNAIKFSDQQDVIIETDRVSDALQNWLVVKVMDKGIGISRDYFDIIFQEFRQVSEGFGRKYQGSGIGLTISKKIIDLLGGKITLESEPGKGSTFMIWLPLDLQGQEPSGDQPAKPSKSTVRLKEQVRSEALPLVLLVEDNIVNKELTEHFLHRRYQVDFAPDGMSALELARQKQYAIVLMDINLGFGMNGIETTRELRKLAGYEHIPVIAVTGYTMADDKDKLLDEGCTHYLAKPFDQASLIAIMEDALAGKP